MKLFTILLLILPVTLVAQKKNDFDDYWAKHDLDEKYQAELDAAHSAFKKGNHELAILEYLEALELKPNDPFAIAKLTDIKILQRTTESPELERTEVVEMVQKEVTQLQQPETTPIQLQEKPTSQKLEVVVAEPQEIDMVNAEVDKEAPVETNEIELVIVAKSKLAPKEIEEAPESPQVIKEEAPKQIIEEATLKPNPVVSKPKTPSIKPIEKYSPEYLEKIAAEYKDGITEETDKAPAKTTIRRIVVQGGKANEYHKVIHNWGAIYFAKNGKPTTERVWLEETVKQ